MKEMCVIPKSAVVFHFAAVELLAMALAMHCAFPWTEANCRRDVSFERPLITARPRARSYASRERTKEKKGLNQAVWMKFETPEA